VKTLLAIVAYTIIGLVAFGVGYGVVQLVAAELPQPEAEAPRRQDVREYLPGDGFRFFVITTDGTVWRFEATSRTWAREGSLE
jgi:hypothetical protein